MTDKDEAGVIPFTKIYVIMVRMCVFDVFQEDEKICYFYKYRLETKEPHCAHFFCKITPYIDLKQGRVWKAIICIERSQRAMGPLFAGEKDFLLNLLSPKISYIIFITKAWKLTILFFSYLKFKLGNLDQLIIKKWRPKVITISQKLKIWKKEI